MKMTLDLPDDVVREMKIRAVQRKQTVKSYAANLLRSGMGLDAETPKLTSDRVIIGPDGIPFIRCEPGAPAGRMTVEELLELERRALEEEDLQRAGLPLR